MLSLEKNVLISFLLSGSLMDIFYKCVYYFLRKKKWWWKPLNLLHFVVMLCLLFIDRHLHLGKCRTLSSIRRSIYARCSWTNLDANWMVRTIWPKESQFSTFTNPEYTDSKRIYAYITIDVPFVDLLVMYMSTLWINGSVYMFHLRVCAKCKYK